MIADHYIYDRHDELIEWAQQRIANCVFRNDACAIGRERDGKILGAVVYDMFGPSSCCMSFAGAGPRWMTREFIIRAFAFPFMQCRFARVTCMISADNEQSLRVTRSFGWTEEGRLREAGSDGGDLLVFGMLARECRFLPGSIPVPMLEINEETRRRWNLWANHAISSPGNAAHDVRFR